MRIPSQEEILKQILDQNWKPVLEFLYSKKKEIATDILLRFAARTFETEFFRQITKDGSTLELELLEELFILHSGKFHELTETNYETLVVELAKKSDGIQAYNYANMFPENEECKQIIKNNAHLLPKKEVPSKDKLDRMNWIEIYNRIFELVNNSEDQSTYFSGNRFIKTLKEFEPYHPDYYQYIELRNSQGKSTSRKVYYYDIIMDLNESTRINFVNRILEMVEPFDRKSINPIRSLLGGEKPISENQISDEVPTVFISYSWDDEDHKNWVLNLANNLVKEGVNVLLDRYELRLGENLPHFVETSIKNADRILIVFTPNYKLKAEKRSGGVGYEYSIMNADLYKNQTNNERIIPILKEGQQADSIPEFMHQYIHLDMRSDENLENSFSDLLREIYDEPDVVKPKLGTKPNFK
ncbi:toll/interleukin-1 receptor domain-containing protein [Reichenbachiella sp.]|uniref:toll/interleukin-1 receptor domain-containing protein n=1 Tax=Reichenbachiella sp. TaxID=2184521 RepID=UPI003BAF1616